MKLQRRTFRSIAAWVLATLLVLLLQYRTAARYDFGPVAHDTNAGAGRFERVFNRISPIILLPLGPIARDSVWTGGRRWTGAVMRALPRFDNRVADCLVFAAVNTLAWMALAGSVAVSWRRLVQRDRSNR